MVGESAGLAGGVAAAITDEDTAASVSARCISARRLRRSSAGPSSIPVGHEPRSVRSMEM
jgi:hypothetical protein